MSLTVDLFQKHYDLREQEQAEVHYNDDIPYWFQRAIEEKDVDKLARSIVRSYQERNYQGLNEYLRGEKRITSLYYEHNAELLNRIIDELPSPPNTTLWRVEHFLEEKLKWAEKHIGKVLLVPSFWSTFSQRDRCPVDPTFQIEASANTRARMIADFTGFQLGEAEALYKSGTLFRITAVDTCVYLEEVDNVKADIVAYNGYTISQDDEDHEDLGPLSLSDMGII
ncbi:ADP-ribosyltransferase [Solirubrum puertoriconensis]|uniref:ADP ribosyltransferase domain-containing protein n=1 Tax=Solirubrum puertoriconensis TaxID=1751427 RepID=A0A9X0HI98_SOLP1|nr:ADP-ribosyltransferase [Solirubrum puertoriconensis]KUG06374.1 hypothetical protein ASU33_03180 [Solirubrum puertoriconensis]